MPPRRLLISILTQIPLATGILAWRKYLAVHYVLALALALLYELGVLVFGFGKKVWAKIEDKLVQSTADWIVNAANRVAPYFPRRYYRHIVREHGSFTVSGLVLIQTSRLRLDQIFVELSVEPGNPVRFNVDPLRQKEFTRSGSIWAFLRPTPGDHQAPKSLAVIGPPGSGKTTLLKHLAISLATSRERRHETHATIPLLLYLRDHIQAITQDRPSLGNLAQAYFNNPNAFATLKPPQNWFKDQLEHGRCLVMLDGLDEVAEPQQRAAVSKWVDAQIRNYPDCRFILTARPQGYSDAPLELADLVLEVQPFNAEQVKTFVENWYLATEVASSKQEALSSVQQRAAEGSHNLLQRLRDLSSLSALTINPLLLTMIATVHRYRGALPGSRVELYAEICEVLLERWRQIRRIPDSLRLKASQKLVVLRPLAAHMMERRIRDIGAQEAISVISVPLELVAAAAIDGLDFLKDLQASSGLLLERESNRWSFAHLTFQEYLTSVHWLEERTESRDWQSLASESWWHETLRLYAAQTNATPLVSACLKENTIPALTLAADFLEESRELSPAIRREVEDILIAGLVSTDSSRRRLAAEVQLSRRVRSLQRIDDRRAIDSAYVTCAEYQLFLDSMQVRDKYFQPPHWESLSFRSDEALRPITGIDPEDATAFCGWLTQRYGGTAQYRLPDLEEAASFPGVPGALATWCKAKSGHTLVGLGGEDESELLAQLTKMFDMPPPTSLAPHPVSEPGNAGYLRDQIYTVLSAANEHSKSLKINHSRDTSPRSLNANQLSRFIDRFLAKAFLIDLFRSRDLVIDLVLSLDGSLGLGAFVTLSDESRSLLERAEKRANVRTLFLAGDLRHIQGISHYGDLDLALAVDLTTDVRRDLDFAREVIEDLELALVRQLPVELLVALAMELTDIVTLDIAVCRIINAINNHDQRKVREIARQLIPSYEQPTSEMSQPLSEMFSIWRPEPKARLKLRKSWARIVEYAYLSYQEINPNTVGRNWRRWINATSNPGEQKRRTNNLLDYYWWLEIISARQQQLLPCWEGIRTTREEMDLVAQK